IGDQLLLATYERLGLYAVLPIPTPVPTLAPTSSPITIAPTNSPTPAPTAVSPVPSPLPSPSVPTKISRKDASKYIMYGILIGIGCTIVIGTGLGGFLYWRGFRFPNRQTGQNEMERYERNGYVQVDGGLS